MAGALQTGANAHTPKHIVDLGAGDGDFLLRVARRLSQPSKDSLAQRSRSRPLNPPPTPARRGADLRTRADSSPPGRGQGWVGSWRGSTSILPRIGTMNRALPNFVAYATKFGRRSRQGSWKAVSAILVDRHSVASSTTLREFEKLGWQTESMVADVFDWARQTSAQSAEVVIANLFLHHFADAQLAELFRAIANCARLFVAVEPRRAAWPLLCSRSLWVVGCNAVTRHDAVVSVRAGFAGRELSALWPEDNEWILTERAAGLFSHLFVARRRS
jgi:hypothetical protein